jgi:NADPH:quinone reductase
MLGRESSGTILSVGPGQTYGLQAGDRVVVMSQSTYADYTAAPTLHCHKLPDAISTKDAAAALLQGLTALTLIRESYHVQKGDWILVHAAAGGVGLWLLQLLRAVGAHVIGTCSTSKMELAKKNGAEIVVDYTMGYDGVVKAVKDATNGAGVAAVFDGVGKDTFETSMQCLARKGTMASFGNASGAVPPFPIAKLSAKNAKLLRPTLFNYLTTREEFETYTRELFDFMAKGEVDVRVHEVYPLKEVKRAHEDLEGRKTTGKLLLKP